MIPLIVRSHYSLMWGTADIKTLCKTAKRLGYRRLALTDTDNLYGLWPFLAACRREGITPIVGAEVTDPIQNFRAVCLAENETGYRNLCRLLTRRHTDNTFNLKTTLPAFAGGLKILTQSPDLLKFWYDAGLSIAAAMPRKPVPSTHRLCRTAKHLKIPLVATPGNFFLHPDDIAIHRLLRAIDQNTVLSRLTANAVAPADAYLGTPAEYANRFAVCPEALNASHTFAESLTFTGPDFGIVLPPWHDGNGRVAAECLRRAAYDGAKERYGEELPESVVERLEQELRIITDMGFAAYFLIVSDIIKQSPRTCGRGSAAASLVAYSMKITNVCPVKHNLYFERFLNPGRTDPPDIDVDFAWDERDGVLESVLTQHVGHAALVSNHVCFQPRMAVREIAKVYGLTDTEIGKVTRRLPWYWRFEETSDLITWFSQRPEAKTLEFPHPWPELMQYAHRILGTPRYLSVHPGGIVITPDPIDTYVPVENAPKGVPIIQWEKDGAEEAGLVKIDLLGNRSLGVVRDALKNMRKNRISFDESRWEPEDDFITQNAISQGRTMGCFYIESPAMRLLQQKSGVGDFEHLVIHSSIIRPAANEFIQEYLRRLHGGEWDPIHPLLTDVLDETFGIMVYQEDVSRAAVSVAGFTHSEADRLRKILSKKDREYHLKDFHQRFIEGAGAKGLSEQKITEIWNMMMSFNGYSFCKPHSASYARVSFQAAYLKTHFPAEFIAAVISNQGGFYSPFAYVSEAKRMGLTVRPPDIEMSDVRWTGNGDSIRVGLLAVKDLRDETRKKIVSQRRQTPFQNFRDFLNRTLPDDDEAKALIHSGALDKFAPDNSRTGLLWELARWRHTKSSKTVPKDLFSTDHADTAPLLPPETERNRLRREFGVLGFLCDRHPMELYQKFVKQTRAVKAVDLPRLLGKQIRLAAWIITGKVVHTKHGELMEFLTFEDETGIVETTFFPDVYRRFCHMIDRNRPYLLTGKVEQNWGAVTLTVEKVEKIRASMGN
jgi:error-prone DNA polymerase